MLTKRQQAALLHIKDGADLFPVHRELARELRPLAEAGLVLLDKPIHNADAVCSAALTITGREALGLQGLCETCGLYDHHLVIGMCPECRRRWPHADDQQSSAMTLTECRKRTRAVRDFIKGLSQ